MMRGKRPRNLLLMSLSVLCALWLISALSQSVTAQSASDKLSPGLRQALARLPAGERLDVVVVWASNVLWGQGTALPLPWVGLIRPPR